MTAPNGPILFNSSTGSDTQASGLGPATAVFGTTGTSTGASAVVSGISTTGVSAGDLFWGDTSSGRQFSIIASVDSGTQVTLDDTLAATHSGNLTWAIGGKRASLNNADSYLLFERAGGAGDAKGGWVIELESGYTETFGALMNVRSAGDATNGKVTLRGASGAATMPVLTANFDGIAIQIVNGYFRLEGFELRNTNASKTASEAIRIISDYVHCKSLRIDHATNSFWKGIVTTTGGKHNVNMCSVAHCANVGISVASSGPVNVFENSVHDCGSHGVVHNGDTLSSSYENNLLWGNAGDGMNLTAAVDSVARNPSVVGNVFHGNGGDGLEITSANDGIGGTRIEKNIFSGNGGYGLNFSNGAATSAWLRAKQVSVRNNAFFSNTSGHRSGGPDGMDEGSSDLTADPFVDAAGGDFNLNDAAGGGAVLRAVTVTL